MFASPQVKLLICAYRVQLQWHIMYYCITSPMGNVYFIFYFFVLLSWCYPAHHSSPTAKRKWMLIISNNKNVSSYFSMNYKKIKWCYSFCNPLNVLLHFRGFKINREVFTDQVRVHRHSWTYVSSNKIWHENNDQTSYWICFRRVGERYINPSCVILLNWYFFINNNSTIICQ